MKKKIYISGQITGIESSAGAIFESAESFLRAKGYEPVNPMKLDHELAESWEDYMRNGIKALMDCDAIYMLSNHTKSEGAKIEMYIALSLKMAIFHEDYKWMLDQKVVEVEVEVIDYRY